MTRNVALGAALSAAEWQMPPNEKAFQGQVTDLADLFHWEWYHTHDARRSPKGFPDLCLVRGSVLLFVELKMPNRHPTSAQAKWLALLRAIPGVMVKLWYPADWPDIVAVLTAPRS